MKKLNSGLRDLKAGILRYELVTILGWNDVKQRYKRSTIGPFWLTISMGVMIGVIGFVFGQVYKTSLSEYLPFLTIGMIFWTLIVTTINEGCLSFTSSDLIIKQLPIPLFVHVLRVLWRNFIIFGHNIIILIGILIYSQRSIGWELLLVIPGLILLIMNLMWINLLLAIVCTRYRDLPQIVGSIMQVLFYLTPIMWMPQFLDSTYALSILEYNPLYHLFEIVREPLLGKYPSYISWLISACFCITGWVIGIFFYIHYRLRITYWI